VDSRPTEESARLPEGEDPDRRTGADVAWRHNVIVAALILASCVVVAYFRLVLHTTVVSTHFVYLSIVLAALWWGRRGLWVPAAIAVFVVAVGAVDPAEEPIHVDLLRVLFFFATAACVTIVSERARAAREAERRSRRELEQAQQRLVASARLASVGELSAGVAHELNNPLGTILLHSHALLKELPEDDPVRQDLELVVGEATRCRNIVRGLLNFARESHVSKAPTDIEALIAELISVISPQAREAGIELRTEIPPDLPKAVVDSDQIRQMLINLVQNAMDAVKQDGEVLVRTRHDAANEAIEIAVADNGCGIPKEVQDKLFTPFFTTKEPGHGTGLGLAMVYGAVKIHAGDITVDSEPGRGSTFTVSLPLEPDRQEQQAGNAAMTEEPEKEDAEDERPE